MLFDSWALRECNSCPTFSCVKRASSQSGGKGVSGGAVAGAVVGSIILLALAGLLFFWYRRRARAIDAQTRAATGPKEAVANADDVLNRPDPNEKAQQSPQQSSFRIYDSSQTNINLDPEAQDQARPLTPLQPPRHLSVQGNPFDDAQSIQTTSTGSQSTNVIPIALVPRTGASSGSGSIHSGNSNGPARPARSPELNLNLEHLNVSKESVPAAGSTRSGASGLRNSFMSTATGATDLLNEAPIIVTSSQGPVRQVLGVHKAEVVQAPASVPVTPNTADSLKVMLKSRPSIRSPLAAISFGPSDMVKESSEESSEGHGDPFDDRHSPIPHGMPGAPPVPDIPAWANAPVDSRPASMATNAGSIIAADISSAKRVQLGFGSQSSAATTPAQSPNTPPRLLQRMASGRLVAPRSGQAATMQEQQERAIANAQAMAAAEQGLEAHRRISNSSVLSAASTRADSILESFPFVPPSPISSLPMRTPPRSPLAQEAVNGSAPVSPTRRAPPSPSPPADAEDSLLDPPDRRVLGMSTGSQLSTASSGLGSFPFQIEHESSGIPTPPSSFNDPTTQRQRASLDTLALTSDLASYPLGYEHPPRR